MYTPNAHHTHTHTLNAHHTHSMRGIGVIFWLSEQAKVLQEKLEKEYQLPTYAVFIVIAIATIVLGLSLGGVSCCIHQCSAYASC